MGEFAEKSNQSLKSAELLVKQHYYSSTVNRSYYACLQFMLYVLFEKLKYDKAQFYNEVRQGKDGTHGWASKLIGNELCRKSRTDYKWFQQAYPEFKKLRVTADYYEDRITPNQGYESIKTAESIINCIKQHFR